MGRVLEGLQGRSAFRVLPWQRFTVETAWPAAVLARELEAALQQPLSPEDWTLSGDERRLRLARWGPSLGGARRTVLAVAYVRAVPLDGGSRLMVTVRPPLAALAFFLYFAASALSGGVAATVAAHRFGDPLSLAVCLLFACVTPALAWSLIARQLMPEVRRAEEELRRALPQVGMDAGPYR